MAKVDARSGGPDPEGGIRRILHIGQDDLFGNLKDIERRFVPTGNSITPTSNGKKALSFHSLWQFLNTLVSSQKYDLVVLPVIQFDWPYDRSRLKANLRKFTSMTLQQRMLRGILDRHLLRRAGAVIALDRFDTPDVDRSFIHALPSLSHFFKTNLRESEVGQRIENARLQFLPYWLEVDRYPATRPVEKDIDVLFLGSLHSQERIDGIRVLESMSDRYRVVVRSTHVPFSEYCELTSRAYLTLSPQGHGYNGFRHYEAMLLGSVPVINRPDSPLIHDFVDGNNCLLYQSSRLRERLETALTDRRQLANLSTGLRQFAIKEHSFEAVGQYVLSSVSRARGINGAPPEERERDRH